MIHPTAILHPKANVHATVEVGPFAIIDADVTVGAHCKVGPHVHLTGKTHIGEKNVFHTGSVIGDAPQDLKYDGSPTGLRIGDGNVFREGVTVHRSNKLSEETEIGSHNFLMANSHVGHNCHLGNHVIIANGALLAGHVHVQDRAFISGNCLVHQFVRVGQLALMQGGAAISKDLPPFTIARGDNGISGLNIIGLRRAGISSQDRLELKHLYHDLFRSRGHFKERVAAAKSTARSEVALALLRFLEESRRGVCLDRSVGDDSHSDSEPGTESLS